MAWSKTITVKKKTSIGLHNNSSTVLAQRRVEQFGNETTVNKQFQLHYVSTVAVSLIMKMGKRQWDHKG